MIFKHFLLGTQTRDYDLASKEAEIKRLKKKVKMLEARVETIEKKFSAAELRKNEKHMLFYTGLDVQRFNWLCGQCTKFPTKTRLLLADDHFVSCAHEALKKFHNKRFGLSF